MAVRRMIHQDVICCDDFLDMSFEAQALFFQLQIKADEYGFVQSPRSTLRMMGASNDSLESLIDKGFVIRFHSGVIVMTHWNKANTRRADREAKMRFPNEYNQLTLDEETGLYLMRDDNGIPTTSQRDDNGSPSISNSLSPSHSPSVNQAEMEAGAGAGASSSMSVSVSEPNDADEDADGAAVYPVDPNSLSGYLFLNNVRVNENEVKNLFKSGFDLDVIFWMMEKSQEADNPIAYFRSTVDDRKNRGATTLEILRASECKNIADGPLFDRHVQHYRDDYQKYLEIGPQEYARQRNEMMRRYEDYRKK